MVLIPRLQRILEAGRQAPPWNMNGEDLSPLGRAQPYNQGSLELKKLLFGTLKLEGMTHRCRGSLRSFKSPVVESSRVRCEAQAVMSTSHFLYCSLAVFLAPSLPLLLPGLKAWFSGFPLNLQTTQ